MDFKSEQYVLSKIEQWSERLPYKKIAITIEMEHKTLTLEKQKSNPIGFAMKGGE